MAIPERTEKTNRIIQERNVSYFEYRALFESVMNIAEELGKTERNLCNLENRIEALEKK
jgi:hypothetical protein